MHLIQIFLPLGDNNDRAFPKEDYARIREVLTKKFGGLTTYARAPAEGLWKDDQNGARHDDMVIFEVMAEELEGTWWQDYKRQLKITFSQDEIIIRVQKIMIL
jgi:hypothetical protein